MNLYIVTNLTNGKLYVGQTRRTVRARWAAHLSRARNGSKTHFACALRRYGPEAFAVREIASVSDQETLTAYERAAIELFGSNKPENGYNLTDGGECGVPNLQVREAISHRMLGNKCAAGYKQSPEHKAAVLRALDGRRSWALGRSFSPEHRARIAAGLLGIVRSQATRDKISESKVGRQHSEASKRNMATSQLGRSKSPETKAKMAEARRAWWDRKRNCCEIVKRCYSYLIVN